MQRDSNGYQAEEVRPTTAAASVAIRSRERVEGSRSCGRVVVDHLNAVHRLEKSHCYQRSDVPVAEVV
jgi:hypothetical protein